MKTSFLLAFVPLSIFPNSALSIYRMARVKRTARKRTGPRGVPRGPLATRHSSEYVAQFTGPGGETSDSQPRVQRETVEERKETEIRSLDQEIKDLEAARKKDRRKIKMLRKKLADSEECKELWRNMLDKVHDQRDAAWERERHLRAYNQELSYALTAADQLANQYRDATYTLYYQLYPPQAEEAQAAEAPGGGDREPEEEYDPFAPWSDNGEGADLYDSDGRDLDDSDV